MYLAYNWDPIYWSTACLIVNSGSLEETEEEESEDLILAEKTEKSTDYVKVAKALGDIISAGVKISLVDINKSGYSFEPDVENQQILFGMKALNSVGKPVIDQIIAGRPYKNIADFMQRCPLNKSAMISLIKSGAFDNLENCWGDKDIRVSTMVYYLLKNSDLKQKLTLQNFNGLIQKDLVPPIMEFQKRVYNFNKYLKAYQKVGKYYTFNEECEKFYSEFFDKDNLEVINGIVCILQTKWDKIYQNEMDKARDWLKANHDKLLEEYNMILFKENWNKYATGTLSSWEMEALCFYYHPHELANIDTNYYGLVDFQDLPESPEVDYFFKRSGKNIPIYKTYKIVGTVIGKNDTKSSISLLTTSGVVNVKFTKEYFAMFARQISEKQEDGKKKVMEKGWFQRGVKVMCTGFRREDTFVCKSYKHTPTHQLYKITSISPDGRHMEIEHERYQVEGA